MPTEALGSPELSATSPHPARVGPVCRDSDSLESRLIGWLLLDSDKWLSATPTCTGLLPPSLDSGKHVLSFPGFLPLVRRWDGWEEAQWLGKTCLCSSALGQALGPWISAWWPVAPGQVGRCVQLPVSHALPAHLPGPHYFPRSLVPGLRGTSLRLTQPT